MYALVFYLDCSGSALLVLRPLVVVPHFNLADLLESLVVVIHVWHRVFVAEEADFAAS